MTGRDGGAARRNLLHLTLATYFTCLLAYLPRELRCVVDNALLPFLRPFLRPLLLVLISIYSLVLCRSSPFLYLLIYHSSLLLSPSSGSTSHILTFSYARHSSLLFSPSFLSFLTSSYLPFLLSSTSYSYSLCSFSSTSSHSFDPISLPYIPFLPPFLSPNAPLLSYLHFCRCFSVSLFFLFSLLYPLGITPLLPSLP